MLSSVFETEMLLVFSAEIAGISLFLVLFFVVVIVVVFDLCMYYHIQ